MNIPFPANAKFKKSLTAQVLIIPFHKREARTKYLSVYLYVYLFLYPQSRSRKSPIRWTRFNII